MIVSLSPCEHVRRVLDGVGHEEATQESSRRGARQVRRLSPERGQKVGEPRKWPQGRPGQKPQEENCCPAKRSTPAAGEAPEEGVNAAIALIRARFGRVSNHVNLPP